MRDLIARYPELFHMAAGDAWPSIRRHGLLGTTALTDRWEVSPARRARLLGEVRRDEVVLTHAELGRAVIRDQRPMNAKMLARVLTDMSPQEWLTRLNSMVFFSPTAKRLESLYAAYRRRADLVLTLSTERLLEVYHDRIVVARLNTGAIRHVSHLRGCDTFSPLAGRPFPLGELAEVAVLTAVPDVAEYVVRAELWRPDGTRRPVALDG